MAKKAQGLSLSTIVLAAIVLIVLVVLVGIFTGYFGNFVPDLKAAGEQECTGILEQFPDECPENYQRVYGKFGPSLKEGNVCCKSQVCADLGGNCRSVCTEGEINDGTRSCQVNIGSEFRCCTPESSTGGDSSD